MLRLIIFIALIPLAWAWLADYYTVPPPEKRATCKVEMAGYTKDAVLLDLVAYVDDSRYCPCEDIHNGD